MDNVDKQLSCQTFELDNNQKQTTNELGQSIFWKKQSIEPNEDRLCSGKFYGRNLNEKQWENYFIELHPNKLYRTNLQVENSTEFCFLNTLVLKKTPFFDRNFPNYRFALTLLNKQASFFLLTDSSQTQVKWFKTILLNNLIIGSHHQKGFAFSLDFNKSVTQTYYKSRIYSCSRIRDGQDLLVKIIDKKEIADLKKFENELENLRKINHEQLQYLIEVYEDGENIYQVFSNYLGKCLSTVLNDKEKNLSNQFLSEQDVGNLMQCILSGLTHLHSKQIIHKDIKIENITMHSFSNCILINFQNSEQCGPLMKKGGSPGYIAPEIFQTDSFDTKVDVYSAGVIFYYLVYGVFPFEAENLEELIELNSNGIINYNIQQKLCPNFSSSGMNLLQSMLEKDPLIRISAGQALRHQWFIRINKESSPNIKSLSTITEQSEIQELTLLIDEFIEDEFDEENLNFKLLDFNNRNQGLTPSKKKRISF